MNKITLNNVLMDLILIVGVIPDGIELPYIEFNEDNGCVDIEWIAKKGFRLGFELKGDGRFIYSYLAGDDSGHGDGSVDGDMVGLLRILLPKIYGKEE